MVRGVLYNTRLPMRARRRADPRQADERDSRARARDRRRPAARDTAPNDRRYPIAVIGRGYHGLLTSSLTRVPGLVSIADVARTALQTPHVLDCAADADAAATLVPARVAHRRLARHDDGRLRARARAARLLRAASSRRRAAALGAALAANLALGWLLAGSPGRASRSSARAPSRAGSSGRSFFRNGLRSGSRSSRRRGVRDDDGRPARGVSLAPIGPGADEPLLRRLEPARDAAALPRAARRDAPQRRFGWLAFLAVALLSLVTIAENQLGADGGGAIVVGVAFALLAVAMSARGGATSLPALGFAALVVLALLNLDAASSSPDHLRGAMHGGINGFVHVATNRVPLAYARMVEQWWLLIPRPPPRSSDSASPPRARAPTAALGLALLGALGASLLVNDSPGPVMIAGLAAVLALEGGLVHRSLTLPVLRRLAPPRRRPRCRSEP